MTNVIRDAHGLNKRTPNCETHIMRWFGWHQHIIVLLSTGHLFCNAVILAIIPIIKIPWHLADYRNMYPTRQGRWAEYTETHSLMKPFFNRNILTILYIQSYWHLIYDDSFAHIIFSDTRPLPLLDWHLDQYLLWVITEWQYIPSANYAVAAMKNMVKQDT